MKNKYFDSSDFGPLTSFDPKGLTITLHGPYDYEINVEEWTSFDPKGLTITLHGPYDYEINVEEWTSAAQVLDWIFQIAKKPWCSAEMLEQFVHAIELIAQWKFGLCAQGAFCPWGMSRTVKW